ncbi:hypothetical protein KM043_015338 [Ampulex compressa]|nr:hypothetical protein KM043_015338 [Ampulex compressa]
MYNGMLGSHFLIGSGLSLEAGRKTLTCFGVGSWGQWEPRSSFSFTLATHRQNSLAHNRSKKNPVPLLSHSSNLDKPKLGKIQPPDPNNWTHIEQVSEIPNLPSRPKRPATCISFGWKSGGVQRAVVVAFGSAIFSERSREALQARLERVGAYEQIAVSPPAVRTPV